MNLITNIVLVGNQGPTQSYIVQLIPGDKSDNFSFKNKEGDANCGYVLPSNDPIRWMQYGNDWKKTDITGLSGDFIKSTLRLYFPQYSVDTFLSKAVYMLSAFTYIHGKKIELGSFETKRSDALACKPVKFGGMDEYYEYVDFEIIDPYQLHYENEALQIRSYFGEPYEINDTGSVLYIVLYIVENHDNVYIQRDGWTGGQNSIYLSHCVDLSLHMNYNMEERYLNMNITFNPSYNDLFTYIEETYNCLDNILIWEYVVMDKNDIYYQYSDITYLESTGSGSDEGGDENVLPIQECFNNSEDGVFKTMNDWKDGLYIIGSVSFVKKEEYDTGDYLPYITIFSNKLPLTQTLFSVMLEHEMNINKINIDSLDMISNNINTVNKIVETTNNIVVDNTDAKSHIIQPVFYQTRELNNIYLHPAVTENISLNLESYKSQVKQFLVQIEGVSFKEIGRTSQGIVFKIYGNMLPKSIDAGTLYILDQNSDLVTTGKYTYIY